MSRELKFARAVPNPDADRRARAAGMDLVHCEIEVAKLLDTMTIDFAFATLGCSSIGRWNIFPGE